MPTDESLRRGADSAAAKAYAFGYIRENTDVEQNMAEFVASGDIAEGFGAGAAASRRRYFVPLGGALNLAAEELGDAIRRDFAIQYGESFAGDVDVVEFFGELDMPFHEKFSMQAAARYSEYENTAGFGTPVPGAKFKYDINTWKIGGSWDVVPALRVRFSQSHDIRAPNHRELYYGQVFTPGSFFGFIQPPFSNNPWTNTAAPDPVSATLFGGARNGVLPEESDTSTIGFVIQPQDSNIRLAIDYFDITLENSISPANLSITIQGCFLGIQSYCDKITSGITTPWQNPALDHNGAPTPGAGPKNTVPCPATLVLHQHRELLLGDLQRGDLRRQRHRLYVRLAEGPRQRLVDAALPRHEDAQQNVNLVRNPLGPPPRPTFQARSATRLAS